VRSKWLLVWVTMYKINSRAHPHVHAHVNNAAFYTYYTNWRWEGVYLGLYWSRFLIFYFQCPIFRSKTSDILLFEFILLSLVIKISKINFDTGIYWHIFYNTDNMCIYSQTAQSTILLEIQKYIFIPLKTKI